MSWMETLAIVTATMVGPVAAVSITRWSDRRREAREKKMQIFRVLMGTRKSQFSNEHVAA